MQLHLPGIILLGTVYNFVTGKVGGTQVVDMTLPQALNLMVCERTWRKRRHPWPVQVVEKQVLFMHGGTFAPHIQAYSLRASLACAWGSWSGGRQQCWDHSPEGLEVKPPASITRTEMKGVGRCGFSQVRSGVSFGHEKKWGCIKRISWCWEIVMQKCPCSLEKWDLQLEKHKNFPPQCPDGGDSEAGWLVPSAKAATPLG